MIKTPARLTFWRLVLVVTMLLASISMQEAFTLAKDLGINPVTSKTWLGLLGVLAMAVIASLGLLVTSISPWQEKLVNGLEAAKRLPAWLGWAGYISLPVAVVAYPLLMLHPYYGDLLAKQMGIRFFIAWLLALVGAQALLLLPTRKLWVERNWPGALLISILSLAVTQRVALYTPDISTYPFAMGWSETSRFYYPALFLGKSIFGQAQAWPILHPSLHFLLIPPYLLDLPLWFHRAWQVALRFGLVGLIAPALLQRLNIQTRGMRWLLGLWIFLILFSLPLYLHLAVPVLMILFGFSIKNDRRTWLWLLLASIWAGLSRINWYPMPGILAAVLYLLESDHKKHDLKTLIKPGLWLVVGTLVAFLSMQLYIQASGIANPGDFFTSLSSTKLWYRLLPNESYRPGVLPGIVLFSLPAWLVLFLAWRQERAGGISTPGNLLILGMLGVLFAGGLVVSTKIGGGADLHNMDAYVVLLLIVTIYHLPGMRAANHLPADQVTRLHWSLVALLVLVPACFGVMSQVSLWQYDRNTSQTSLAALQQRVDQVNAGGGKILFITQRHLISMHMLQRVRLIPEYEREELMEMAMSANEAYLKTFRADLEKHRFAAIVVDPLRFNFVGDYDAMGAENNAWTRYVAKKILCNYQQDAIFAADRIAIYVPQSGQQKCP